MRRVLLLAVLALALLPASAAALTVDDIAKDVRCPTCNTPLNVSDAPVARDMKQYIRNRIEAGDSRQEIIDGLVIEFGSDVLATPPKSGFGLVAWLVPALAVAIGLALIPILMRVWAARRPRSTTTTLDAEDEALLAREREERRA